MGYKGAVPAKSCSHCGHMKTENLIDLKLSSTEYERLTHAIVSDARPRQKEYFIRDTELKGFFLRVLPSGVKTYGVSSRLARRGNKIQRNIGQSTAYSCKDARKKAKDWLIKLDNGTDPKHADRGFLTPVQLLEEYIKAKNLAEKTISGYRYNFNHYLKGLAKRSIQDIATEDIVSWYTAGTDHATGTERTFVTLKSVLDFAYALNYIDENPASKAALLIKRKKNPNKQLHLSNIYTQLPIFMTAFVQSDISIVMRDWMVLCLTTGLRKAESMQLKWNQVDLQQKRLTLPTNKSDRLLIVPMVGLTYDMFQTRFAHPNRDDVYVFISKSKTNTPINDARKALKKVCDAAGIPPYSHHDFRRLFASVCAELDISETEIGKLLNHAPKTVTPVYINQSLETARRHYQKVVDELDRKIPIDDVAENKDEYFLTATDVMRDHFYGKVDLMPDAPISKHDLEMEKHTVATYWEG
jgi:integrase